MVRDARLVLSDGEVFEGTAIGAPGTTVGEAVFTTGMTGYQEVLTDPSFCHQVVCMTAPQMGNTGTTPEDDEGPRPHLAGFVVHELSPIASNWRSDRGLDAYLRDHGVVGIANVDTRALTRHIRDHGAQMCAVGTEPADALLARAKDAPPMSGLDLTGRVTTAEPYAWQDGSGAWQIDDGAADKHVVVIDYGVKRNILRCLSDLGCRLTVLPASATADDVLARDPDGVFLSNGPGDPAAVAHGIEAAKALVSKKPVFGICLGHQLLAHALGAKTFKLKFGHRGLNHPVKDLTTGKIEITTQNHGFAVDLDALPASLTCTHLHLNDSTCQGVEHADSGAFGVQFHPEAGAGPHDSRYLFGRFLDRMRG
ncbi:MAG: glutamine-hydrolyzing carbamoyl-phosphate synthase small subunit [Sandaracinaceae bacterium]|nr:glutamine-hydrolyzing carbamoyl-phosphate synthase small subunit [Sandaracinaceae bacterium]